MTEQASVNIPKDILEPIIRAHIQTGVVAAIGDPATLIEEVVRRALTKKVDRNGTVSNYSTDNKYDLIEIVAQQTIEAEVKKAVIAWIEDQKPAIQKAVADSLKKKTGVFAKALVDGFVQCTKQDWRISCNFNVSDK